MNIKRIIQFLKGNKDTIESLADLSNILQSLAAIFTIFGIVFVGLEYYRQKKATRQEKAFELYQQFNQGKFIERRDELNKAFYEINHRKYPTVGDYINAMQPIWKNQNVKIISITNFFEQVATCFERELCDKEATTALFGKEATEFLETHYQFFCLKRENGDKKIGKILEGFVEKVGKNIRNCDHIKTIVSLNPAK